MPINHPTYSPMDDLANIIFSDSLEGIHGSDNYVAHALCLQGSCSFVFNTGDYEMHPGDLIIVRRGKSMSKIEPSADFKGQSDICGGQIPQSMHSTEQLRCEGFNLTVPESAHAPHC